MTMRTRTVRPLPALLLALGLTAAGCTDDAEDAADEPQAAAATDDGESDADAADDEVVEVALFDYSFGDLPESVPAGTRFTITNEAEEELHELVAFRLPDDEDRSVEELAELPPPELLATLGEPTTVLLATPGGDPIPAVGDGTLDEPGRYGFFCFIPTGVDPQVYLDAAAETEEGPPQIADAGPPHIVHGMIGELTVE